LLEEFLGGLLFLVCFVFLSLDLLGLPLVNIEVIRAGISTTLGEAKAVVNTG